MLQGIGAADQRSGLNQPFQDNGSLLLFQIGGSFFDIGKEFLDPFCLYPGLDDFG